MLGVMIPRHHPTHNRVLGVDGVSQRRQVLVCTNKNIDVTMTLTKGTKEQAPAY